MRDAVERRSVLNMERRPVTVTTVISATMTSTIITSMSVKPPCTDGLRRQSKTSLFAALLLDGFDVVGRTFLTVGAERHDVDTVGVHRARAAQDEVMIPGILLLLGHVFLRHEVVCGLGALVFVVRHAME